MPFRIQRALIDNIYNLLVSDKGVFYVKRRLERGWVTWRQEAWDSQGRRECLAAVATAPGRGEPQVWTWILEPWCLCSSAGLVSATLFLLDLSSSSRKGPGRGAPGGPSVQGESYSLLCSQHKPPRSQGRPSGSSLYPQH